MADVGGADGSDDEQVELSQDQEAATLDMDVADGVLLVVKQKTASHLLGLPPGLPLHHP